MSLVEELSRAVGIALAFAATGLGTYPIILFGNEEQKKYLPDIAAGQTCGFWSYRPMQEVTLQNSNHCD